MKQARELENLHLLAFYNGHETLLAQANLAGVIYMESRS